MLSEAEQFVGEWTYPYDSSEFHVFVLLVLYVGVCGVCVEGREGMCVCVGEGV